MLTCIKVLCWWATIIYSFVYDESELGKEENHFKNSEVLLRKILFLRSSVPSIVRIHSLSSSSSESSAFCVLSHNVIILTEIPVRSAGTLLYKVLHGLVIPIYFSSCYYFTSAYQKHLWDNRWTCVALLEIHINWDFS